jgi:hypothetical protein
MNVTQFLKSKRAQLQAMEPIMIVIVLAIIAGIVLLFYVRLSSNEQQAEIRTTQSSEDVQILGAVARMPELLCPNVESVQVNCIDYEKAKAFSQSSMLPENKVFYNPLFGNANITLYWIDSIDSDGAVNIKSTQLFDTMVNRNKTRMTITYFTLYKPIEDRRYMAWMQIEREIQ